MFMINKYYKLMDTYTHGNTYTNTHTHTHTHTQTQTQTHTRSCIEEATKIAAKYLQDKISNYET